jgi:hypothetical protein
MVLILQSDAVTVDGREDPTNAREWPGHKVPAICVRLQRLWCYIARLGVDGTGGCGAAGLKPLPPAAR